MPLYIIGFKIKRKEKEKLNDKGYYEEQEEIKKSFKSALKNNEDEESEDDTFLNVRNKTKA